MDIVETSSYDSQEELPSIKSTQDNSSENSTHPKDANSVKNNEIQVVFEVPADPVSSLISTQAPCTRESQENEILTNEMSNSCKSYACAAAIIGSGYACSLALTASNKFLFDSSNFNFPLLVTCIHFSCTSLFLVVAYNFTSLSKCRPKYTCKHFFKFLLPVSLLNLLDVSLSNLAYAAVSLSVMTLIKSTVVVMTYLFAVAMGLEKFRWKLFGIVLFTAVSISLTVSRMQVKHAYGIIVLCAAVMFSAMRWVLIHHQIQIYRYSPAQLIYLTQPTAAACLAIPAYFIDVNRLRSVIKEDNYIAERLPLIILLISIAVIIATVLVYIEFKVIEITSSLSFTMVGVGKEILTVLMSVIFFREKVDFRTYFGIGLTIIAILIYSYIRISIMKENLQNPLPKNCIMTMTPVLKSASSLPDSPISTFDKISQQLADLLKSEAKIKSGYHPLVIENL